MKRDHERAEQIETLLMEQFEWSEAPEGKAKTAIARAYAGIACSFTKQGVAIRTPT